MINTKKNIDRNKNLLDGLTILRFAHAYESGGGVEQHLADLNCELSRRNRLITIQMRLTAKPNQLAETEEEIGYSRLIYVPLFVKPIQEANPVTGTVLRPSVLKQMKRVLLERIICTPALNDFMMRRVLGWRKVPRRSGEPEGVGLKAAEIIQRCKIDIVVLHTSGGADASEVIGVAKSAGIPLAIVHHFSNDRLGGMSMRQQISCVHGVGGGSWVGVPSYLKTRFWNLSDAVDTEFYKPENARHLSRDFTAPVLYAPARITPAKGQLDVIKIASILKQRGLNTRVIFAGRVDSPAFEAHLREEAAQASLSSVVEFLGQVSLEQYRDWYGAACVMVLPTYHHEGMPRTLIDSQAMKVPPVVYDIGGTKEGVKDQETGYVVRLGDVDAAATAVETLLRNPDLYNKMAEAGRRFVEEQFSLPALADRHERFYLHVIDSVRALPNYLRKN